MSAKQILIAAFLTVVGVFCIFTWFGADDGAVVESNIALPPSTVSVEKHVVSPPNVSEPEQLCSSSGPPLVTVKARSSDLDREEIDRLLVNGVANPNELVLMADKGDAMAALALFKITRNCFRLEASMITSLNNEGKVTPKSPHCPTLPKDIVANPLKLLDRAAAKGSPEAQLAYAGSSRMFRAVLLRANTSASIEMAAEISRKSLDYGEKAARSGLIEAYGLMSQAYENGSFGMRDPERAYAFALAFEKDQSNGNDRAEKLKGVLTKRQQENAKVLAFGCPAIKAPSDLVNPFK